MLSLEHVSKTVPGGRVLFHQLSLTLAPGEFVAVMGESGAGKSTLLNLIAGLDDLNAGSIRFDGIELNHLDDDARTLLRRESMGFVFQAFHILPYLTLTQNVALPLVLQKLATQPALARAEASLHEVGLGARGNDYPAQLSGGELQRVAIARALVHQPRLVLADEPTGNLDPDSAQRILALLKRQQEQSGAAVILVTHSTAAAAAADRVLQLTPEGLRAR